MEALVAEDCATEVEKLYHFVLADEIRELREGICANSVFIAYIFTSEYQRYYVVVVRQAAEQGLKASLVDSISTDV